MFSFGEKSVQTKTSCQILLELGGAWWVRLCQTSQSFNWTMRKIKWLFYIPLSPAKAHQCNALNTEALGKYWANHDEHNYYVMLFDYSLETTEVRMDNRTYSKCCQAALLVDFLWTIFFFLAALCGMQDLSSPTRDRTHTPCTGITES